jgi:ribosome-associated protein
VRKLTDILAERARAEKDDRDLRSRSDARRERKQSEQALADLSKGLVEASQKQLGRLGLPESVLEVVLAARRIESPIARSRALRLVRKELRASDFVEIENRLRELREPPARAAPAALEQWQKRLIENGDTALDALVEAFPEADRQRLRTLVRNVNKAKEAERSKANRALTTALRQLMR